MSTQDRDPIFDSLDRLADMADTDVVGDRMPDIQRRVRVARRRKAAGAGIAVAAVLVVGFGVGRTLLSPPSEPDPAPSIDNLRQTVTIDAEGIYSDLIHIRVSVAGRSSAYTDPATGEPVPAEPLSYQIVVDGRVVKETTAPEITCEEGGEVSSYTDLYPPKQRRFVAADVAGPGEHVVEVHAPYCADGELVDEPAQVTVTTVAGAPVVQAEQVGDVDGDGQDDTVQIVSPADGETGDWTLDVEWAVGGRASLVLPDTSEWGLLGLPDLDGDGRLEIVLNGGGGESVAWLVYRVTSERTIEPVTTVNQAGDPEPMAFGFSDSGPQNTFWQLSLLPDGIYSWQFQDAFPQRPAPVLVRRWLLSGDRLTLQDATGPGCVDADFRLSLGSC